VTTGRGEASLRVTVLLFGSYRDLASERRLEVKFQAGDTVADLLERVEARVGRLGMAPAIAVNGVCVPGDRVLVADDEVALLPPVAGG
jgi:molybdopterin synthase catalytic subunit/molybdopterin synthase sulfur carrier subunit